MTPLVQYFTVGKYKVKFEFTPAHANEQAKLDFTWFPYMPKKITKEQFEEYKTKRNAIVRNIADKYDIKIAVVDL